MTTEALTVVGVDLRAARRWIRENLFSSVWNSLLTALVVVVVAWVGYGLVRWALVTAQWEVVRVNSRLYMLGRFPGPEVWRVWASIYLVALLAGLTWGRVVGTVRVPRSVGAWWQWVLLGAVMVAAVLYATALSTRLAIAGTVATVVVGRQAGGLAGDRLRTPLAVAWLLSYPAILLIVRGMGGVEPRLWGGFFLTLMLTVSGIAISFPFGVLLALGRASSFPAFRWLSIAYIELIRGVPLITVLFMAFLFFPLFVGPGVSIPVVIRALGGIILFTAAYVAENVRGGLQSIPVGQFEAARALGLSPTRTTVFIILPQALRNVIPALVGQFISLFKDTSLVIVVGLLDLLNVALAVTQQPGFRGRQRESLVFAAFLYWVVAYSMSRWSQRLERRLGLGER